MIDRTLRLTLRTTAPVHVGAGESGLATDLPVLRDHRGRPYLPGTHLAGRLREVATRLAPALGWSPCHALRTAVPEGACTCPVCGAFGSWLPRAAGDVEPLVSRLWCFDAPLAEDDPGRTLVRDGVGIDRTSGASAARAGALYDLEWIPAETAFEVRIGIEAGAGEAVETVLALAVSEWVAGRGRLGAAAARGGGAFRVDSHAFCRAPLATAADLLAYLRAGGRPSGSREDAWLEDRLCALRGGGAEGEDPLPEGACGSFAEFRFHVGFEGAVLVNDPAAALALGVHGAPVHADPAGERPVLPGSTLRGVLRAQAERILRTLAAQGADAAALARRVGACHPFDTGGEGDAEPWRALRACTAHAEREADARECPACTLFGSLRRGSRLWVEDAGLVSAPRYHLRDFVAIDRFTGGAKEGAKFDALPLHGPVFAARLLLWNPAPWELALLALALRDLSDGLTGIGAGQSRGFGRATLSRVTLALGHRAGPHPLSDPDAAPVDSGIFRVTSEEGPVHALVGRARSRGWVSALHETARHERRAVPAGRAVADVYLGTALEPLYPVAPGGIG